MKHSRLLFNTATVLGITGLLTAFVLVSGIGCTRVGNKSGGGSAGPQKAADPWVTFRTELVRQPDVITARRVLNQLNSDLNNANQSLPEFPTAAVTKATEKLSPGADEARDWTSAVTTSMDANYLGESLFFRSVARSLDLEGLPVEQQAKAAFAWVCRQVYDRPWMLSDRGGQRLLLPPVPPQYVLRRGYGIGFDRESVFLALARQLGLDTVLVGPPGGERLPRFAQSQTGAVTRGPFWAVGVRNGADVLLFDPWLGAAIPTADGKGILTLAAAKANPRLVTDWVDTKKTTFTVTAEDVTTAVAYATAPVNAIPPRMKAIESQLAADLGVKLAVDLDAIEARGPVKWYGPKVEADPYSLPHVLGSFLPTAEGGYDAKPAGPEQLAFLLTNLEPVAGLFAPPAELKNLRAREQFASQCAINYRQTIVDSDVREKIQRGQFNDAIRQLVALDRTFALQRDRARDPELQKAFAEWYAQANSAYEKLTLSSLPENAGQRGNAEADVDSLWRNNPTGAAAVLTAVAQVGAAEVAYCLALVKHEQAERSQTRYRKSTPENKEAAKAKAAGDWAVAKDEWTRYLDTAARSEGAFPGRAAHARTLAARAATLMANPDAYSS
ncbi:hypothetical protein BH11PLA2_BH11PLA2_12330 [soil metagenome]